MRPRPVDAFVEAGGTLIDTADVYADGAAERVLGALSVTLGSATRSSSPPRPPAALAPNVVSTRHAVTPARRTRCVVEATRHGLRRPLAASRLGSQTPFEESLSAADEAVRMGKARYIGVSNYCGWQTAAAAAWQSAVPGRSPGRRHPSRVLAAAARY